MKIPKHLQETLDKTASEFCLNPENCMPGFVPMGQAWSHDRHLGYKPLKMKLYRRFKYVVILAIY